MNSQLRIMLSVTVVMAAYAVSWSAEDPNLEALEREFTSEERNHWSFQPIRTVSVPAVRMSGWARQPVDRFVLRKLEHSQLKPAVEADRRTWLRRVYLDLIGLPPTPEQQRKFLMDSSVQAYEKVVDQLLAREEYGERWARHWLDVVRYAESNGYERDGTKPHAWRYRDYVIRAFNSDKPYSQFLIEQIAGDEIIKSNSESQIATTFLRLGTWDDEPADPVKDRYDQLDDILATTSAVFMASTLQCARCHEHKFEPFTQVDYARILAVFDPLKRPQDGRQDLDRLVGTTQELSDYKRAMESADSKISEIESERNKLQTLLQKKALNSAQTDISKAVIAAFQTQEENRSEQQKQLVEQNQESLDQAVNRVATGSQILLLKTWKDRIVTLNALRPEEPPRAYVWYEETNLPPATKVFYRGDPTTPAGSLGPDIPGIFQDRSSVLQEPKKRKNSSGRRIWFANWLTNKQHPLTARVLVNRIWQWHFGEGIVSTESNFGLRGDRPTHPELLDWLAGWFVENGWCMKPLHRMIVLSSTYRMSSVWNQEASQIDPEERLLWRWKPRRLDAETIRDSILSASGTLNRKMFGPSIYPSISRAVLEGQSIPGNGWGKSDELEARRRSVYVFVKRSLLVPELELLDFPDTTASCEQRVVSTVAPQALTFMNGLFIHEQAASMAARLEYGIERTLEEQISKAFQLTLCRLPSDHEIEQSLAFIALQTKQLREERSKESDSHEKDDKTTRIAETHRGAMKAFCLVLMNTDEFVFSE